MASIKKTLLKILLAIVVLASSFRATAMFAQVSPPRPYASIQSRHVAYLGPGRGKEFDLTGRAIRIGLLVPLDGPQKADGEAIVTAARMALEDDSAQERDSGGRTLALAIGDESGPSWGRVGDVLIHLVMDQKAIAVVTSADGATAHLSEQVGNRLGVPILTLATDRTTTQIDIPWIFRLGPSDDDQALAIARAIYRDSALRRVVLVTESGHDGRVGGQAFQSAVREFGAAPPVCVSVDALRPDASAVVNAIKAPSPQAVVFWTQPNTAHYLLPAIREAGISLPVYLTQKSSQASLGLTFSTPRLAPGSDSGEAAVWAVEPADSNFLARRDFTRRYQLATGSAPGPVAAEAYNALRMIARAFREAGPNRARLRDALAADRGFDGGSAARTFDNQGNSRAGARLVRLQ